MATIKSSLRHGPATEQQIASLEARIGASLPDDYREFLRKHNGGRPQPDAFLLGDDFETDEDVVQCFFPLRDVRCSDVVVEAAEQLADYPIHCAWDDLQNFVRDVEQLSGRKIEHRLFPIGTDGCANFIAIVLDGEKTGRVVFFEHEDSTVTMLAESFTSFLSGLRTRQRGDYHEDLDFKSEA